MLVNHVLNQPSGTPHMYEEKLHVIEYPNGEKYVDEARSYDAYGIDKQYIYTQGEEPETRLFLLQHDHPVAQISQAGLD